jgi:alpha-tubulin suppressor-like RCC1 family protein
MQALVSTLRLLLRSALPLFILTCLYCIPSFAQSEINNPVTYDTTITETAYGGPQTTWNVRITRQKNDASKRPAFFFIPGVGEVGSDASKLTLYGPHFWLQNGWDGGVKLGNGTHYPVLVSIQQPKQNMRPWDLKAVFDILVKVLPINANAIHVTGLSQGSYEWGELIEFAASAGDVTAMSHIKSFVDLEGVAPGDNFSGFNQPYPSGFGVWAKQFGGKFFGLEGTQDTRNVWQISGNMNSAVANSAFFAYENIGGGGHCCWNSMYDPSVTNWSSANANIAKNADHANTMGNYKAGSNIFQWMLRQGDTTLVKSGNSSSNTPPAAPTVNAGGGQTIKLPASSVTLAGTASAVSGSALTYLAWSEASGPSAAKIASPSSGATVVSGLTQGTYVFTLTAKDNAGNTSTSNVTIVVNAPATVSTPSAATMPAVSAGSAQTIQLPASSVSLAATVKIAAGTTAGAMAWTRTSGPAAGTISTPNNSATTTVSNLAAGTYIYTLTVKNNLGQSASSGVQITVKAGTAAPAAPTVNAGGAQTIQLPASSVTLAGTATAASGASLTYLAWTKTGGPAAGTITSPSSGKTTVTGLGQGSYVFTLTAKDNGGRTSASNVAVVVNPAATVSKPSAATMPAVTAGNAQTVQLPTSSVSLAATVKIAAGTTASSTVWSQTAGPVAVPISTPNNPTTTVSKLTAGVYRFTMTVKNNLGQSASSGVQVTVKAGTATIAAPTVNAGGSQTIQLPTNTVTLTGSASAAAGASLSYLAWTKASGPSAGKIANPSSGKTAVSGLSQGTYVFTLSVKDNGNRASASNVTVVVNAAAASGTTGTKTSTGSSTSSGDAGTSAGSTGSVSTGAGTSTTASASTMPTVSAGLAQTVQLPTSSASLAATVKIAAGTAASSMVWTKSAGPATGTINTPNNATSTVVSNLVAGVYRFTLTVKNNLGQSASSGVQITVKAGTATGAAPTVNAGNAQTIQLPTSSVTLTGTAAAASGASLTYLAWTKASGPAAGTITNPSSGQTNVTGLTQGSYVFTLSAKDNAGKIASANTTVVVNTATATPPPPVTGGGGSTGNTGGGSTGTTAPILVGTGEYQVFFIDTKGKLYGSGGNIHYLGVNDKGTIGTAIPVAVPSNLTFKTVAGALHGGLAVDTDGNMWTWGDGTAGQIGDGNIYSGNVIVPVKVTTDATGQPFNNVVHVYSYFANNTSTGFYAVKGDGTLWIWGDARWGMKGDGSAGGTITRPTQVIIPGGRKVNQITASNELTVLCTDGTIWTCGGAATGLNSNLGYSSSGNNYLTLHQISAPANVVTVASGNGIHYALTASGDLYGWGFYGSYMGGTGGYNANDRLYTPTNLASRLKLRAPVKAIACNMVSTHVVLTDGTLWGWGDNAVGTVGNGKELDYSKTATPYSWDFHAADLLQQAPVQLTNRTDFVAVFGSGPFVLYNYAETSSGQLYSWGRNKGCVLGNGVMGCYPDVTSSYPNSWDVPLATAVDPLGLNKVTYVASPFCLSSGIAVCVQCLLAAGKTTIKAVANLAIAGTTTQTSATSTSQPASSTAAAKTVTTDAVHTATLATAAVTLSGDVTAATSGTDAATASSEEDAVVITRDPAFMVNDSTFAAPAVADTASQATDTSSASRAAVLNTGETFITATLDGSQSSGGNGSPVTAYAWSQVAGPSNATIASPDAAVSEVKYMQHGQYVFQLTVTDMLGGQATAYDTLVINDVRKDIETGVEGKLTLYPSITHDNLTVHLTDVAAGIVNINIYDMSGRVLKTMQFSKGDGTWDQTLSVGQLSAGAYIMQVLFAGGKTSVTGKFVKQ